MTSKLNYDGESPWVFGTLNLDIINVNFLHLDLYNLNSKLKIKSAVLLMRRLSFITLKCLAHFCKY